MPEHKGLENGKYQGQILECDVYTKENGVTVAKFGVSMNGITTRRAFVCLTKIGGEPNEFGIARLKEIFPAWDGDDPSWLAENSKGVWVTCAVLNEKDEKGRTWSNIKEIYACEQPDEPTDTELVESEAQEQGEMPF